MWAIAQNALNERADESNQPWQLKVRNAPLCFCNCHSRIYMESVNSLEQEQLVLYLYSSGHDYDSPGSLKHRSLLLGFSGWVRSPRISPDKQILKQNLSIATFWFGESIFWQKFPGWNFSPQTLWPLCGMQKHDRGRTQGSPHISGDYLSSQAMPHSLLGYLLSPFTNTYFFWNLDFFFFFNGRQDALSKSVKISWQKKNIFPGQTW